MKTHYIFTFGSFRRAVCSLLVLALVSIGVAPTMVYGKWVDRSGELPGLYSGSDIAKQVGLVVGIAGGAALAIHFLTKGSGSGIRTTSKNIRFEKTGVGKTAEHSVDIQNTSKKSVTLASFDVTGLSFSISDDLEFPVVLKAGEIINVPLHFTPAQAKGYKGKLRFMSVKAGSKKQKRWENGDFASRARCGKSNGCC